MGCSKVPKPVFIQTNLGTRLAVPLRPDMTAKEFKRELEKTHLNCFPECGSIMVSALMVKQKSSFYHLSESLPLKYAFLGSNGTWFLQIDVHPLSIRADVEPIKCNLTQVHNLDSAANVDTDSIGPSSFPMCTDKKRSKCKRNEVKDKTEAVSETFSESVSVSGIISKYFSDYDEVASTTVFPFSTVQNRHRQQLWSNELEIKDICLEKTSSGASIAKSTKPQVGTRLLLASDSLRLTPSNQQPALSLSKYSDGKSPSHQSSEVARNLVFEITEEGNDV